MRQLPWYCNVHINSPKADYCTDIISSNTGDPKPFILQMKIISGGPSDISITVFCKFFSFLHKSKEMVSVTAECSSVMVAHYDQTPACQH